MVKNGAPHGTVLISDSQTAGRGRLGRSFHSPGGMGIYMSVILRYACKPE
jgi:BirA family biotin operon repressor/biotin-[acetyl-CoA-carboxylase] ligase